MLDWEAFAKRSPWEYELKLEPSELKLGHFVRRMDIPWRDTDFPLEGVLVDTFDVKRWFLAHCEWVVVDLERSHNKYRPPRYRLSVPSLDDDSDTPAIRILRRSPIDQATLTRAIEEYHQLDTQADELIEQIEQTSQIDVPSAAAVVDRVADALADNLAALVWLTRIKQQDRYTAQHCVNVAILCMGLAVGLEWSQKEVREVGLAGLLHDLGKVKIDPRILRKPGRLDSEEFEEIKKHARFGYEMLMEDGSVNQNVAEGVLWHHERADGKGYPLGLPPELVSPMAKVISVVDAYDAITSHRSYDPARSHHEALGILWKNRGTQFDRAIVESLISFMGWVTPGTLVRLSTGVVGIVLESPTRRGLRPMVALVAEEKGRWRLGKTIDLDSKEARQAANPVRIEEVLPDNFGGIDVRQLTEHLRDSRPQSQGLTQ